MYFGEFLIEKKLISESQLDEGLKKQKEIDKPIGETLVSLRFIEQEQMDKLLEEFMLNSADSILKDPQYNSLV